MPRPTSMPALSRQQAIEMMDELIEAYRRDEFQNELHRAWDAAAGDPVQQARARQAVCLTVQGPVIVKYGFEQSRKGVAQSLAAFNQQVNLERETEEVLRKCQLVGWLVNPAQQRATMENEQGQPAENAAAQTRQEHQGLPPDTSPLTFAHLVQDRPLLYGGHMGGQRAMSAFLALPPDSADEMEPLMRYLREDPTGPFAGLVDEWPSQGSPVSGRWADWGFDVGAQGKEQMLKADWHSVHSWGSRRRVFVPRFGDCIAMRRAPPRILAFLEAFREANLHCWYAMLHALEELKRAKDCSDSLAWLADLVGHVLRERGQFGAIEAQVWWGPRSTPTRSHKDGATSLLHLSLTLGGRRSLRLGTFGKADAWGPSPWVYNRDEWAKWQRFQQCDDTGTPVKGQVMKENNVWDEKAWRDEDLVKIKMTAGNVYLSSPFVFEHGVMYDQCDRAQPIIALQCRLAFQYEKHALKVNDLRDKDMLAVTTALAESIREFGDYERLRMPTLHEVLYWEGRIAEHLQTQMAEIAGGRYMQNIFHKMGDVPEGSDQGQQEQGRSWEEAAAEAAQQAAAVGAPVPPQQPPELKEAAATLPSPPWEQVSHAPEQEEQMVEQKQEERKLEQELEREEAQMAELKQRLWEERRRMEIAKERDRLALQAGHMLHPDSAHLISAHPDGALRYFPHDSNNKWTKSLDLKPEREDAQQWVAVGGGDAGGILVRVDQGLNSRPLPSRLSTGALVEELEVVGNRLHYRRLKGEGPDYGWVSIKVFNTGRVLMQPYSDGMWRQVH